MDCERDWSVGLGAMESHVGAIFEKIKIFNFFSHENYPYF